MNRAMRIEQLTIQRGNTRIGAFDAILPAGRVSLMTGASGTGKTSLCLALAGFIQPIAGRVTGGPAALVPQNPREWLNPRHRVEDIITRTGRMSGFDYSSEQRRAIAEQARLPSRLLGQY